MKIKKAVILTAILAAAVAAGSTMTVFAAETQTSGTDKSTVSESQSKENEETPSQSEGDSDAESGAVSKNSKDSSTDSSTPDDGTASEKPKRREKTTDLETKDGERPARPDSEGSSDLETDDGERPARPDSEGSSDIETEDGKRPARPHRKRPAALDTENGERPARPDSEGSSDLETEDGERPARPHRGKNAVGGSESETGDGTESDDTTGTKPIRKGRGRFRFENGTDGEQSEDGVEKKSRPEKSGEDSQLQPDKEESAEASTTSI